MDKILISLFVPALPEHYEIWIPVEMTIAEIIDLLLSGVFEMSANRYFSSGEEMLFMEKSGVLADIDKTAKDYGLKDGDKLMLL